MIHSFWESASQGGQMTTPNYHQNWPFFTSKVSLPPYSPTLILRKRKLGLWACLAKFRILKAVCRMKVKSASPSVSAPPHCSFPVWQWQARKQRNQSTHPTVSAARKTNDKIRASAICLLPLNRWTFHFTRVFIRCIYLFICAFTTLCVCVRVCAGTLLSSKKGHSIIAAIWEEHEQKTGAERQMLNSTHRTYKRPSLTYQSGMMAPHRQHRRQGSSELWLWCHHIEPCTD